MIRSFSQWTTTELNFPKVAVHFLSACDEWLRLPGNSDPLSHSLNSQIAFSTNWLRILRMIHTHVCTHPHTNTGEKVP